MNFRQAKGKQIRRLDTGIERNFSNFLFIDQYYASNPVLRRIFSLARKPHQYHSLLIEEITEADCALLVAESKAMAIRRPTFTTRKFIAFPFCVRLSAKRPRKLISLATLFLSGISFPANRSHVLTFLSPSCRRAGRRSKTILFIASAL